MKKQEIIEIWKELIILAWTYDSSKTKKSRQEIIDKLDNYKSKLSKNNSKYSNTVSSFIIDLKDDLLLWKKLNIDSINNDDYIENYFISKNEIIYFNNLILKNEYRLLFEKDTKNQKELYERLYKNFIKNLKLLNSKNIAKNLLIFTLFKRVKPMESLYRINLLFSQKLKNKDLVLKNLELIKLYKLFTTKVFENWIEIYNRWKYNYKFMKLNNNDFDSIISDASKAKFRSWNPKFEYKELLKKLQ